MNLELSHLIMDVLRKYASESHHLNQKEIFDYLKRDYQDLPEEITERKVRAVMDRMKYQEERLNDSQKTLRYEEKGGRNNGYWAESSISDVELKFLIDSVMYGNILTSKKAQWLAKRIQDLSGKSLYEITRYASGGYGKQKYFSDEVDVLENVDTVLKAQLSGRQIQFKLNVYTVKDGKIVLEPTKEYTVSPLEMVLSNGRYYMIAANGDSDKLKFYRIDLMTDIRQLKDRARRREEFNELKSFQRSSFMRKHPFMYGGQEGIFRLKIDKDSFTQAVDAFSDSLRDISSSEEDGTITVTVEASEGAMKLWLLQYGDIAQAVDMNPAFAEKMRESIEILREKYKKYE